MKFLNIYLDVLKNFGDFKTRTNRAEFWIFILINIIISILIGYLGTTVSYIYSLIIMIPSLAVGTRRLHDIGKSGWNQLWSLTIIGILYIIILWIKDGDKQENKWGEEPAPINI